jgi:hypothetical protein
MKATKANNYYYKLRYKGKTVDRYGNYSNGVINFHSIKLKPKEFLDFDAKHIPKNIYMTLEDADYKKNEIPYLIYLYRENDTILLKFFYCITSSEAFEMDNNPFKQMFLFFELLKKSGYKTEYKKEITDDGYDGTVIVTFPAKGNVYDYYKKHTKVFSKMLKQAASKMGSKKLMINPSGDKLKQ